MRGGCGLSVRRIGLIPFPEVAQIRPVSPHVLELILKNKGTYHVNNAIKLGRYNVGREGAILTIPLYMGFLIEDRFVDEVIPDVDLNSLNPHTV